MPLAFKTLLALALLATASASAQVGAPSPFEDRRALTFQLGPDLNLSSFDGAALSYRYHRSATHAFRFGLSLSGGLSDAKEEFNTEAGTRDEEFEIDRSRLFGSLGFDALTMTYRQGQTPAYFYYGFGPALSVFASERDEDGLRGSESQTSSLGAGVGLAVVVGVEWPAAEWLTLLAEYGVESGYVYRRETTDQGGGRALTEHAVEIGSRGARVGVSVLF